MTEIKLPKLPDRTPVKLAIVVSPELHAALNDYAAAYEAAYGAREALTDLVPAILASFIEGDRAFARRRK
jgi:hypothetical protein